MKINTLFQRKGVLFFYVGILLTLFFIGCDLEFGSNSAIAPETPSFEVKPAVTNIQVTITPPTIKGTSIAGDELKNEDIIYHVYYSSHKHGNVLDLISFAKSSADKNKKQAGKIIVAGQKTGTSTGTILSLSAETKYYITVVAVNGKVQLLESDPTSIKEATTGKSSSSTPSGNDKAPGAATIKSVTADGDSIIVTITAPTEKGTTGSKANTLNDISYLIYVSAVDPSGNAQAVVDSVIANPLTDAEVLAKEIDNVVSVAFPKAEETMFTSTHLKDSTKFYVVTKVFAGSLASTNVSPLSGIKEVTTGTATTTTK